MCMGLVVRVLWWRWIRDVRGFGGYVDGVTTISDVDGVVVAGRGQATYENVLQTIDQMGRVVDSLYTRAAKLS